MILGVSKSTCYASLSVLGVLSILTKAWLQHEEMYPRLVYLSTDKLSLGIFYNFAFLLFICAIKLTLKIFVGRLSDREVERLVDSGRGFLLDMILFLVFSNPTIDGQDVAPPALLQFMCLCTAMKLLHGVATIRSAHVFEIGVPRISVLLRLAFFFTFLTWLDFTAFVVFWHKASKSSTFFTWLLFETMAMTVTCGMSVLKFVVHLAALGHDVIAAESAPVARQSGPASSDGSFSESQQRAQQARGRAGVSSKSVWLFYLDLMTDILSMTVFLSFMIVFITQNTSRPPLYMTADVLGVARTLSQRIRSFRRYRRLTANMDAAFKRATEEEASQADTCIICRDVLMAGDRKLPCGHIFHVECLRSWFIQQQSCPTCRAEIPIIAAPASSPLTRVQNPQVAVPPPPQPEAEARPQVHAEGSFAANRTAQVGSPLPSASIASLTASSKSQDKSESAQEVREAKVSTDIPAALSASLREDDREMKRQKALLAAERRLRKLESGDDAASESPSSARQVSPTSPTNERGSGAEMFIGALPTTCGFSVGEVAAGRCAPVDTRDDEFNARYFDTRTRLAAMEALPSAMQHSYEMCLFFQAKIQHISAQLDRLAGSGSNAPMTTSIQALLNSTLTIQPPPPPPVSTDLARALTILLNPAARPSELQRRES